MKLANLSVQQFLDLLEKEFSKAKGIYSEMEKYAICGVGKRIRPTLMFLVAKEMNDDLDVKELLPAALCIEYIHNYSLVHDDLPCMDNDDMRRGKPSVHAKFGETNAVLLGDKLLTEAFKISTKIKYKSVVKLLSQAADDMLIGQYKDLNQPIDIDLRGYFDIYTGKTGALMRAAILSGYLIATKNKKYENYETLEEFCTYFGATFQLYDDLSDHDPNSAYSLGEEYIKDAFNSLYQTMMNLLIELNFDDFKEYINKIFISKM